MKKELTMALSALLLSMGAKANIVFIKSGAIGNAQVKEAGIYFNGGINNQTVTWLLSALAEIHESYHNVNNIDLYLNSEGGDMDAGYVAYEALRKNPIKLNMINTSMTASAATMIYCASPYRYSMPMAQFVLHPAAAANERTDYLRPDQARRILEDNNNYNAIFRKIYASCVKLSDKEIQKITESESGRVVYKSDEALTHGIVTKGVWESHSYPLTYFITNADN